MLPAALLFSSCSSNVYVDKAFFAQAKSNRQTLAILPVEVLFTGKLPKNWTDEHVAKLEKEQSSQLQEKIYEDFVFHASAKAEKNKWAVDLVDSRVVNDKLQQQGISLHESWKIPSDELARILEVDMIVRARVHNVRYMSQAAATGINVGASILEGILSRGGTSVYTPRARAGESDINLSLYHSSRSEAVARVNQKHKLRVRKLPVYIQN